MTTPAVCGRVLSSIKMNQSPTGLACNLTRLQIISSRYRWAVNVPWASRIRSVRPSKLDPTPNMLCSAKFAAGKLSPGSLPDSNPSVPVIQTVPGLIREDYRAPVANASTTMVQGPG